MQAVSESNSRTPVYDASPESAPVALDELIARQQPGYSLERKLYTDPGIFETEVDRIIGREWLYVDHASRLREPGDYLTFDVAGESVIVLRDHASGLRAFYNVCRHRGSRICLRRSGRARRLTCPYHGWSYGLDGSLSAARQMPADFDRTRHSLHPCQVMVLEGLVFVCLHPTERPATRDVEQLVQRFLAPHELANARIAHVENYPTRANWKLVAENFWECYHCPGAHPEYCAVNAFARPAGTGRPALVERWQTYSDDWVRKNNATNGFPEENVWESGSHYALHQPIQKGFSTLSETGEPLAPLMGRFADYDGGETAAAINSFHSVSAANDHAVLIRFTPLSALSTDVHLTWLVHPDAVEGKDYQKEALTWMWHTTLSQDTELAENNQLGVNSRVYGPGPYSQLEEGPVAFLQHYLRRMHSQPER